MRATVLAAVLALTCRAGVQVGAQPAISLTLHEPVIAPLVLWNTSAVPVEIQTGSASELSYRITITRSNGEIVKAGVPLWAQVPDFLSGIGKAQIAPGQSYTRSLLLNEWLPFDEPGRYQITVALPAAEGLASFEVDIAPRDPDRLRSVCERLATDASDPLSAGRFSSARALSLVADDVAIPYLRSVAAAGVSDVSVEGLIRLGDLQAVSALASLPQGRYGLARLLELTSSEPVKQAIRAILASEAQK